MGYNACISEIQKAAGRALTDDELDDLVSELQRRQRARRAEDQISTDSEIARQVGDDYARDMAMAAAVQKRNAAINERVRIEVEDFIATQFADNPSLGMEAWMVGVNRLRNGSRNSAAAEKEGLLGKYMGGLAADLQKADLTKVFTSGAMDREIARAMWARNRDNPLPAEVPREARDIAEILVKWSETTRDDANKAGAWVGRYEGYIVRQSHEYWKIARAGFDRWKADIENRLDWSRIDTDNPDEFLRATFDNIVSGVHIKSDGSNVGGSRNIAKKMSEERVLHFKSADDWYDYNASYGNGTMREAFLNGLQKSAQDIGIMRRMGTNPQDNYRRIADTVLAKVKDPLAKRKLQEEIREGGRVHNFLTAVDGSMNIPTNHMAAQIQSSVTAMTRMTVMGASLLSQMSDIPLRAAEMRYQGGSFLGSMVEAATGVLGGRTKQQMIELDGELGIIRDSFATSVASRFSIGDDGLPGSIAKAQNLFFKFNLMQPVTDNQRASSIRSMSHRMALNKNVAYNQADDGLKRVLSLFGIAENEWNAIRQSASRLADDREYVTPESIKSAPDSVFEAMVKANGQKVTAKRVEAAKEEVASKFRNYLRDRAGYMTIMPDDRTRAITMRGSRPGSIQGIGMRSVWELKGFAAAVIQKAMGREIYGRGSDTVAQALRNGNGEMLGLANMIMWQTIFGYLAMAAKDAVKGREPRVPEDAASARKIMMAAFVQGGGAGIYGDFMFGEVNRYGGGLTSTLVGPTVGKAESLYRLYGKVRDGDDAAAEAFRNVVSNVPGNNLFYTRMALDYLVLWNIQDWLNPGSIRRMERRIEQQNNQKFLISPSEAIR